MIITICVAAILLYLLGSFQLWRAIFGGTDSNHQIGSSHSNLGTSVQPMDDAAPPDKDGQTTSTTRYAAKAQSSQHLLGLGNLAALACHAITCWLLLTSMGTFNLGVVAVSNLVSFIMALVVVTLSLRINIHNLLLFIFPICIITILLGLVVAPGESTSPDLSASLIIHILLSLAAYSALMMAACQSILLAIQERQLKSGNFQRIRILPPLESMERFLVAMLWIGFLLLSASIASGYLFLEDMFAQQVVHHIVLTSSSWVVYAFFIVGRYFFGWRGLTAVRWTMVGFTLLVIGYLGSKFVLEYLITGN